MVPCLLLTIFVTMTIGSLLRNSYRHRSMGSTQEQQQQQQQHQQQLAPLLHVPNVTSLPPLPTTMVVVVEEQEPSDTFFEYFFDRNGEFVEPEYDPTTLDVANPPPLLPAIFHTQLWQSEKTRNEFLLSSSTEQQRRTLVPVHRDRPFVSSAGTLRLTHEWYRRKMRIEDFDELMHNLQTAKKEGDPAEEGSDAAGLRRLLFDSSIIYWSVQRTRGPRSLYLRKVLHDTFCRGLMHLAESRLAQSLVGTDAKADTAVRTSTGCFLTSASDRVHPANVALRVAAAAMFGVPISHIEPTQILRYQRNQRYRPHFDAWELNNFTVRHPKEWRGRVATIVVWLNSVSEGGNTSFPGALGKEPLTLRPVGGDGVLFYSVMESFVTGAADHVTRRVLKLDESSMHAGEEAADEKWVAALWCHLNPTS